MSEGSIKNLSYVAASLRVLSNPQESKLCRLIENPEQLKLARYHQGLPREWPTHPVLLP
ncbi:MAG: hypothetical protein WCJ72_20280 [Chryseobacterium sp.]